jgi:hypothetical protein
MSTPSLQEWFCLREGRKNFTIDPLRDQEHLFGEPSWQQEMNDRLRKAQALGAPVRLVWWGQFGIGKTHRLRHTEYLVRKNGYSYDPCYVIATDIEEKSGFERLHFELVSKLEKDRMREIVSEYALDLRTHKAGAPPLKAICGGSADVEAAMQSFGGDTVQNVVPAWRFLCGLRLKDEEVKLANVTKEALNSSLDFAGVIGALASIIQYKTGKELLYLIDEGENLTKITKKSTAARWQETLRTLLDVGNVGIVIAIGAERQDGIPPIILQPDIVRRFQRDNYIQMEAYKPPVAKSFVRGLLRVVIDPERRAALEAGENFRATAPDYDPEIYPFTTRSFERFCDYAVVDPRTAKPSEIIGRLNSLAAGAYFAGLRLITGDHLTASSIP